ncbi:Zn-ribbon domain-containing OB-fold protein [Pseudorhodoferax sp.]|uniref:Zn-ribbon domain-containing OB-fold protein n=1 Tax=Pseudorhodoferax sp. TaxID=1993553 RepID=UPI002DD69649|nr:Zn-ribbon domain-containing OB-fold protein [Pseudorhodoferax sp.]
MHADRMVRPSADAAIDAQPHWDGLAHGRFLVQRCAQCGLLRHYPRPMCAACHAMEHAWVEVGGRATVRSWTICHHAFLPELASEVPYVLAIAELDEGVRVNLPLTDVAHAALRIGLPVRLRIVAGPGGAPRPTLVVADPADAAAPGAA